MEENNAHPSKRRRLDDSHSDSSPDELGPNFDDPPRPRASWSTPKDKVYRGSRAYNRSQNEYESDSPDELAEDSRIYWSTRKSGNRPSRDSSNRSERRSSRGASEESSQFGGEGEGAGSDADKGEEGDVEEMDEDVEEEEEGGDGEPRGRPIDRPMRSPTPPPPPPKPDRLNYREKFILKGHLRGVSAVQFSPDGTMVASCGADATIRIWEISTGKPLHTFEGHLAGISTIAWSPDSRVIASGSDDKSIRLWNVQTGKAHPKPLRGHHNYIYAIAFSPKGNMLVSGSYDEAVYLWDVRSAKVMRSLPAHSDPVAGIDVVRDGTLIVSCAGDGLIRVWDTGTGQCLRTLVHEDNPPVTAVKFSPNGKYVLAWTLDDCVRLWNYVEGRCIKTYQGHANRKYSLSGGFGIYGAPGGTPEAFAVSGSEDGAVLCWDVVSKNILQKLEGHRDVVLGVDTCSKGERKLIASCGLDRTVRVWEERDLEDTEVEAEAEPVADEESEEHPTENNSAMDIDEQLV